MPQPTTLRLILNAAALAAARPTLLFSDWKNAARLFRNKSDWLRCDGLPVAVKCASGLKKKKTQQFAVHAGGGAGNGG